MRKILTFTSFSAVKRNEIGSFVETWMNLETVIQSEVSQKEKNKYRILTHTCGIQKNGTDESVCRAERDSQTWKTNVWLPKGKGGRDKLGIWD